jgi:hypothetical protein
VSSVLARRSVLFAALCVASTGCFNAPRAAVSLKMTPQKGTPKDASVYIDEQFIGPLYVVAARGVRLPEGEHRITVEKAGYFPWDRLVVSVRKPITLDVQLVRIPE